MECKLFIELPANNSHPANPGQSYWKESGVW